MGFSSFNKKSQNRFSNVAIVEEAKERDSAEIVKALGYDDLLMNLGGKKL